jgi:hypothetical protein
MQKQISFFSLQGKPTKETNFKCHPAILEEKTMTASVLPMENIPSSAPDTAVLPSATSMVGGVRAFGVATPRVRSPVNAETLDIIVTAVAAVAFPGHSLRSGQRKYTTYKAYYSKNRNELKFTFRWVPDILLQCCSFSGTK